MDSAVAGQAIPLFGMRVVDSTVGNKVRRVRVLAAGCELTAADLGRQPTFVGLGCEMGALVRESH